MKTSSLPPANSTAHLLPMDVLQQFRLIFGSMRQYFRLVEERCGMSGSQMWVLQEVQRTPEIGIGELATRLGVHQSTCSLLVDKLVASGCLIKKRQTADQRRVGLCLDASGLAALNSPGSLVEIACCLSKNIAYQSRRIDSAFARQG